MSEPDPNQPADFTMNRSHHDVFISYAQLDKPIADAICAKLEARKIRCWIAPRDVPPSKEFPAAIVEAIEGSQVLILIFSSHANSSPHVIRELTSAVNKGRIIIPFRVEDVPPSKSMEYLISVPHWLDAITRPLEKHIDGLADTIGHILANKKENICPECNTHLPPQAKFCNACGAKVLFEQTVTPTIPQEHGPLPQPVPEETVILPEQTVTPMIPQEHGPLPQPVPEKPVIPDQLQEAVTVRPDQLQEAVAVAAELSSATGEAVSAPPRGSNKALIGAILAIIVVIAILIVIIPMIHSPPSDTPASSGGFLSSRQTGTVTTTPVDYRGEGVPVNIVTLTVEPTQTMPKGIELYVEADKESTSGMVTVQFNGGGGMGLVQDNSVILTRSDGTVATGKLDFNERHTSIELQGTKGNDRLQVIVTMKSGSTYTILDKLMTYRFFHSP